MFQEISARLAIAGTLTRDDLEEIRRRGYRVIVDLRGLDEPVAGGLSPAQEEVEARKLDLEHHCVEVSVHTLDDRAVERARDALETLPGRVVLHCGSGRRAAILATIDLGCKEGLSAKECLTRVRALGFDCDEMPALRDLLVRYVDAQTLSGRRRAPMIQRPRRSPVPSI